MSYFIILLTIPLCCVHSFSFMSVHPLVNSSWKRKKSISSFHNWEKERLGQTVCYTSLAARKLYSQNIAEGGSEVASATTGTVARDEMKIPPDILGPPEPLRNLNIGYSLDAFRRVGTSQVSNYTIERISYTPDAFVLRNFLSSDECNQLRWIASHYNMTQAETITKNDTSSRTHCQVTWIPSNGCEHDESNLVANLVSSTANLLLSKTVLSNPSAGVEDLQVLKYGEGGEFVLHHDGEPRVLTVIYYLNGVGGTWFPLARTNNDENEDPCKDLDHEAMEAGFQHTRNTGNPQNKAQALDLGNGLQPGSAGILVKGKTMKAQEEFGQENNNVAWIEQGDALAFYNYCDDGSARLNWRSLHSGLPTTEDDGEKWIANHWFRVNDLSEI